jgi:DNA invertase Pin-like site-specific DNA recombinase
MEGRFVGYYRVSTAKQGASGLGLEAQRVAVAAHLNGGSWELVGEFTDVESGKHADRPELARAMDLCRLTGAKLLIAKLDRLSRNVHFLSGLMERGVDFVAVDMPSANKLTVHIMAAVAEQERDAISARTKAALAEIKAKLARGETHISRAGNTIKRLGSAHPIPTPRPDLGAAAVRARADAFAERVKPVIAAHKAAGASLAAIAGHLNAASIPTPRGALWTPTAVKRVLERGRGAI